MSLLDRRVRGFRLVDLVAFALLVMLVLGVYLAKTMAGRERAEIATAERSIGEEKARIRLLQAEVAHLEEPARLERLSQSYLGLGPVPIKHDLTPEGLYDAARASQLASAPPAPPQAPRAMSVGAPQPR